MDEKRHRRIRTVGRVMKVATWLATALFIAAYGVALIMPGMRSQLPLLAGLAHPMSTLDVWIVATLAAIPLGLSVAAMVCAARLFAAFERNDVLEHRNGRLMIAIGLFVIAGTAANNVVRSAVGAYLSHRSGAGSLTISLSSGEVGAIGCGILIVVLGWVVAEAADLAHDHRQIV